MEISTRENAEKEAKAELRWARRRGTFPHNAAGFRRECARQTLKVAKEWRERGKLERAVMTAKVARGHLIIARILEREAKELEKTK